MNAHTVPVKPNAPSLIGDFWGGLAAMLVALPSSIAFGVLVFTAIGPEYAGQGAVAGILGAAALGIVSPLIGRTNGLISAPCAPAAAVLSALAASLYVGASGVARSPEAILPLLALTILLAAVFQIFFSAIGGGRLIKFVPYPVVSGYLSGVGVLIALGQIPKLLGLPHGTPLSHGLLSPDLWQWQGIAVGVSTMTVMGAAPYITKKIPGAILGLASGMIAYFAIAFFSPGMLSLGGNPFVIGSIAPPDSLLPAISHRVTSLFSVNMADIRIILVPALTLSVLLSIDTLKTCVVLDALTRSRHHSDRELMGQGVGNLAAFLTGGMSGAGTIGPTLVNVTSGGRTPRSAVIEGSLVVLALLLLGRLIAWVPIGALAGILLVTAWRTFDKSIFRLLAHPSLRLDFVVIAVVVLTAVTVDLIAASGVGVALAILLFIRDQIRGSVIRRKRYLNEVSSNTRRLAAERAILDERGSKGVFCELQGNLFFGTTDQLFSQLEQDLRTQRFILFDMRRVQSIDYTAAHLFEQMQAQLAERGGRLLFSGMPSTVLDQRDFEHYLTNLGVVGEGHGIMISETLDGALEWMEEQILEDSGMTARNEDEPLNVNEIDLFRGLDGATVATLAGCMRKTTVAENYKVFECGSRGDEIFFVRRGRVQIMLPLEGGKRHHLATIGRGDFFGELSFLDFKVRSADVEAKVPTDLYILSRTIFNEQVKSDPAFGVQVLDRLAVAVAERLRRTDMELKMLEER